ncbi:hypothetical protein B0O99DRAFT_529707, partial [Bisporella sp. PMI_857]
LCSMADDIINIKVGSGRKAKTFQVDRDLICSLSPFIRSKLSNPFRKEVLLETHVPASFDLFSKWLQGLLTPESYLSIRDSEEPWLSHGADICLLAMDLQCPQFEREALQKFTWSCALAPFGPWAQIEREAAQQTPLRRFSNYWIAWNFHLAGSGRNEYDGLEATTLASNITGQTQDPRVFEIEHWFERCGASLAPECDHDPVARLEKLRRKALNRKPFSGRKELMDGLRERALQNARK